MNRFVLTLLSALAVTVFAAAHARADVVAFYVDGTDDDAAAEPDLAGSALVTAGNLTQSGFENGGTVTRTEFGAGNDTPAGPTAGSSAASEWLFARMQHTPGTPGSGDDYFGFTVTADQNNVNLTTFTFDHVIANASSTTGLLGTYELFASVNSGSFISLGSGSSNPITSTDPTMSTPATQVTDLAGLPLLSAGDTVEFRIAIADNSDLSSRAQFIQGIQLEGQTAFARYQIDIDSTRLSGGDTSGTLSTATGWTSLDATTPADSNGASVTIDGITFEVASADSSRLREASGNPNPNALTGDFVFDDGPGESVILQFGGAGDLAAGEWQVELWSWDETSPFGDQIVGYRTDGVETIITSAAVAHATDPMSTFTFTSDGVSAYDVFLRENNSQDRSRLNAVRLTQLTQVAIPTPAALPAGLAMLAVSTARRRRQ